MRRLGRLLAPAAVCLAFGLLQLTVQQTNLLLLRGGLVAQGSYAATLELAVVLLAIAAIDDLRHGAGWVGRRTGRRDGWLDLARQPVSFRAAARAFYTRPFVPVAAVAFGFGLSLISVVIGAAPGALYAVPGGFDIFIHDSELLMAAVFVLVSTVFVLCRAAPRATAGCVVGLGFATVAGQLSLTHYATSASLTILGWAAYTAAVSALAASAARQRQGRARAEAWTSRNRLVQP